MKGMVVAPQPRAAEVGAKILADGGNAFDAAIATAFAQMVVDPMMASLGGMGGCTFYDAASKEVGSLSFHTRAGAGVRAGMWEADARGQTEISGYTLFDDYRSELGYTSIMTPGTVAGFGSLAERFATMDLPALLQPAIDILDGGFPLPGYVEDLLTGPPIAGEAFGMTQLTKTKAMSDIWVKPDGSLPKGGERFYNNDMLRTFRRLAENGWRDFYHGDLAREMAADLEANGSYVTLEDFQKYDVRWSDPLHVNYRGYDIYSLPAPASGVTLLEILKILEGFDLTALGFGSTEHLHAVASAMSWAHFDRRTYLGDPDFVDVPIDRLLSDGHTDNIRRRITEGEHAPRVAVAASDGTTQVTTWDAQGNVAAVTHTLVACSGVITPGLGFIYNNSMKLAGVKRDGPNALAPGKARNVGMCPTVVMKDGEFVMALGAPGGSVIISAVLQSILNVVHFDMTPVEAVCAPRIHCEGGSVFCESRILEESVNGLRRLGHDVKHHPASYARVFARPQLIVSDGSGGVWGGSDPRHEGGVPIAVSDDGKLQARPFKG